MVVVFFATFATDLVLQAFVANFIAFASPGNPYVYAHPTKDVLTIAGRIDDISVAYPAGRDMPVLVVCPGGDYWPLPWYLRSFKNVGYYNDVNEIRSPAPVVIASAGFQDQLISRLFDISPAGQKNLYVPLFDKGIELRPQVELRGYVTKDLWDQWQSSKSDNRAVK
jgi:predicted membrane-bound mannosyltransferase